MSSPGPSASRPTSSGTEHQPSLPSIAQLHPDLPPASGMSAIHRWTLNANQYTYPGPPPAPVIYNDAFSSIARQSIPDFGPSRSPQVPGSPESDDADMATDQADEQPKKRRRRQALSCTECKRRKIKCDRAQPCAPCTRRNEPDKCHWATLETADKYVARADYDGLKARHEDLQVRHEDLAAQHRQLHNTVSSLTARIEALESVISRAGLTAPSGSTQPAAAGTEPSRKSSSHRAQGSSFPQPSRTSTLSPAALRRAASPTLPGLASRSGVPDPEYTSGGASNNGPMRSPYSLASITTPYSGTPPIYRHHEGASGERSVQYGHPSSTTSRHHRRTPSQDSSGARRR